MTAPELALTHECPVFLCTERIDPGVLMCPCHWRLVPAAVRRAVWIAWRRGTSAGTPAHRAAICLAIAAVNRDVVPASSIKHPACGSAVESLPQAGPVSRSVPEVRADEHF
jgi:hypothetical protein